MGARLVCLLAFTSLLAVASAAAARDEAMERVKALYRTAAYEDALAILDQMARNPAAESSIEAREYRLLCLIALDRKVEAHDAIASMVQADPFYQLSQASPRVRAVFKDVRQSLLPSIVQRTYADAKAAFDRQDPQSGAQFERVLTLLDDPDIAESPVLTDLRTVASAFRDLSNERSKRPATPPVVAAASDPASSGTSSAPPPPVVYREGEPGLAAPEPLSQTLPRWILRSALPARDSRERQGILEVVIDENGDVISAVLRKSFHPEYDAQLIKAAMSWKYRPALKNGAPVRFLKLVNVRLEEAS